MKKTRRNRGARAVVVVEDPMGNVHTLSKFTGQDPSFGARSHVREIRRRAAHGGDYFTGWKAGYAVLKNKGGGMKRGARRNPHALDVAWTGQRAHYVSPRGNYGETGYSELAMHTGGAGKGVVRFALWRRPAKGWSGPRNAVSWAQVEYANGQILDGLPSEVLPGKVRDIIGYGSPKMPGHREKLKLWALSKGVAANPGKNSGRCTCIFRHAITPKEREAAKRALDYARRVGDRNGITVAMAALSGKCPSARNPLTVKETRSVLRAARSHATTARVAPTYGERNFALGKVSGVASVAEYYGRGKAKKHASKLRLAAGRMSSKSIKVRKNVGSSHPIWKAGYAVHKFMSSLDGANLRAWRDVPVAAVIYGGTAAKRAFAASVATVQGRMKDLAMTLQGIANLRYYKTLLKTPLRAVAGSFGLMEMLRSDF
jgi:hypothetical protein